MQTVTPRLALSICPRAQGCSYRGKAWGRGRADSEREVGSEEPEQGDSQAAADQKRSWVQEIKEPWLSHAFGKGGLKERKS